MPSPQYREESPRQEAPQLFAGLAAATGLDAARNTIYTWLEALERDIPSSNNSISPNTIIRMRDCNAALRSMVHPVSERLAGFSVTKALWDLACRRPRSDLGEGFYAEMVHLLRGCSGHDDLQYPDLASPPPESTSAEISRWRSEQLDLLWQATQQAMARFTDGLAPEVVERRRRRRRQVQAELGGGEREWNDWKWQVRHVLQHAEEVGRVVHLEDTERSALERARAERIPVGITPYYASLLDEQPGDRDRALRAQVLPPLDYVDCLARQRQDRRTALDFMGERYTAPVELVTRRYPAICILKPYNTCPQICVYCQRNWEIERPLAPGALAPRSLLEKALSWIGEHPAIREVLITGGDPLVLGDERLRWLLERLAAIEHVDLVRIGTRTPVTLPMRITENLARLLGSFRKPGRRELCVVTHVESAYEITPELVAAVERLRRQGIGVYNQLVYTFFVSRRFEAANLRMLLRRVGIDPYYTFVTKGKQETAAYRVPLARLLQEQKEESRLLPGSRRTDEVVFNVPRLGKNHVRATQHRTLLAVNGEGARVYEFHPWEKNIVEQRGFVAVDVPILDYLRRLEEIGEDSNDYASIWYYF